jgi:hypothetical protein
MQQPLLLLLFTGSKYETLIVDSGYKVYMKLRIRNVSQNDFMQYKCVAKNSLGGSDGSITLYGQYFPFKQHQFLSIHFELHIEKKVLLTCFLTTTRYKLCRLRVQMQNKAKSATLCLYRDTLVFVCTGEHFKLVPGAARVRYFLPASEALRVYFLLCCSCCSCCCSCC